MNPRAALARLSRIITNVTETPHQFILQGTNTAMDIKVSDYILGKCVEAGIRDTFMVTGGGAMHLDDSFGHSPKMQCTFHHNEQACAMAAEAYARVENRPAVVLVTTGPGATNAITGVLCAWMESIPMMVISGQARYATTVRGSGLPLRSSGIQEYDVTLSAAAMTKYAVMIERKEDVRYCVEKAIFLMENGRKGPVWLDVPLDVQAAKIDPEKLCGYDPADDHYEVQNTSLHKMPQMCEAVKVPEINDAVIGEILDRLAAAERPVLFGGAGVRASGAKTIRETDVRAADGASGSVPEGSDDLSVKVRRQTAADSTGLSTDSQNERKSGSDIAQSKFLELAMLLGIPTLTGMSSMDLVHEDFPYYAGRTGMTGTRSGNFAMAGSDVFLSIGSRLSYLQTGFDFEEWARGAYVIANELSPEELRKPNVRCDMPVIGDASELMDKLIGELKAHGATAEHPYCEKAKGWTERSVARKAKFPAVTEAEKAHQKDGRSNIYRFYDVLSDALKEGEDLVISCGTSRVAGTQAFRAKKGQRIFNNSNTASMGYDTPAAIGVAEARRTMRKTYVYEISQKTDEGEKAGLKPVTLVTGEGSLMMNLQELQTIVTNRFPVRIFVIRNGGYHSIRQTQNAYFGKPLIGIGPESGDLDFPTAEALAACFGMSAGHITSNETIEKEMEEAMGLPLPAIIDVEVSPLQKTEPKSSARKLADGTMVSSPLEDMAPFLSREELAENLEIPLTDGERG